MSLINHLVVVPIAALSIVFSSITVAENSLPHNNELREQIQKRFLTGDQTLSSSKITTFEKSIQTRVREVLLAMARQEKVMSQAPALVRLIMKAPSKAVLEEALVKEGLSEFKNIAADLFKESISVGYRLMLEKIAEVREGTERISISSQKSLKQLLDIDYSSKVEGNRRTLPEMAFQIGQTLKTWKVSKVSPGEREASNLQNPQTGQFYTAQELEVQSKQGLDISRIQPDSQSPIWGDRGSLYDGLQVIFPKEKVAIFKSVRKSQSIPKLNVYTLDEKGKKQDIKLKFAAETHGQPTASALLAALGFHSDLSKHVAGFKIILGKTSIHEFKKEVLSYFTSVNFEREILSQGSDQNGNYVVLKHVLIEPKIKGITRLGPWPFGLNGNLGLREARAIQLFNIWVANGDVKESENNKLLLKEINGVTRLFQMQHDNGNTFGDLFRETPETLGWNVVKDVNAKEIRFNYTCFQENALLNNITFADGKWFTRILAQLTRKQIEDAVQIGGWPKSVGALLVEKLISRRNDFVKAFDLEDETPQLTVDRALTTPDGLVVRGSLQKAEISGYPTKFDAGILDQATPYAKELRDGLVRALTDLGSGVDSINLPAETLGLNSALILGVNVQLKREIQENLDALDPSERFIVKDRFELGLRLTPGVGVGGKLSYVRGFTLIYPKKSKLDAQYAGKFVYNMLLPYSVAMKSLPEKHVLIVEDFVEGGGVLKLEDPNLIIPIGMNTSISRVMIHRTIVSTRDSQKVKFYEDRSIYNEIANRIFIKLVALKINLATESSARGSLHRKVYTVSRASLPIKVDRVVSHGEFSKLEKFAQVEEISTQFLETMSNWSFFGLLGAKNSFRQDFIERENKSLSSSEIKKLHELQVSSYRSSYWAWLDNGEMVENRVFLASRIDPKSSKVLNPAIQLSYGFQDLDVRTKELSQGYLKFIGDVTGDSKFIALDVDGHSLNQLWGPLKTAVKVVLSRSAILNLYQIDLVNFKKESDKIFGFNLAAETRRAQFSAGIVAARRAKTDADRMVALIRALRKIVWQTNGAYDGRLLGLVLKTLGTKDVFVSALIAPDASQENTLPGGIPFYNQRGVVPEKTLTPVVFGESNPVQMYLGL